ncbi:strawberry notch-like NTP hydrolase domain-containing protein [Vibrio sp. 10N.286.45.F3]
MTHPSKARVFATNKWTSKEPHPGQNGTQTLRLQPSKVDLEGIIKVFPNSKIEDMPTSGLKELWEGFDKNTASALFSASNSIRSIKALQTSESIGLNSDGVEIFLTGDNERYYENGTNLMFSKYDTSNEFMGYDWYNRSSFKAAAEGLLMEMIHRETIINETRLDQIIETAGEKIRLTSNRAAEVQTRIVNTLNSLVLNDMRLAHNKDTVDLARLSKLNDRMAHMPLSHRDSSYSKPLPPAFSFIARSFLEAIDNCETVSIINDHSTALTTLIPSEMPIKFITERGGENIYSKSYQDEFGKTAISHLNVGYQTTTPGSQVLLVSDSGDLDEPIELFGTKVNNKSDLQALRTLNTMSDSAQAMIVMDCDNPFTLGEIAIESYDVHSHIFQNFNVVDMFDTSPIIFGDNEVKNAKRVYLINGKKAIPSTTNAPTEIKALYSINDVYDLSATIKDSFESAAQVRAINSDDLTTTTSISDILANYTSNQTESSKYDLNFAQARYTPLTSLARANDMAAMPANFVNSNREAVIKLIKDVGNPDQFLMKELEMTSEEITDVWDAEQIDAITIGIWRLKNGKPFLQGDATGKGKGRTLAGYIIWSIKQGRTPIFMTSKPDLLSDIYRDIRDTKLESHVRPFFMMANDQEIIDKSENATIFDASTIEGLRDGYLKSNLSSINENLILTTYSQVNGLKEQKGRKKMSLESRLNERATWLLNFIKNNDVQFLFDESHNIANVTSNRGKVIDLLTSFSKNPVVRASATWSKNAKNIAQCSDLFPDDFTSEKLEKMVSSGGTAFQESLSSTLIAEGAMVRREHNFGKRIVNIIESQQGQRNKIATDVLASIMQKGKEYGDKQLEVIRSLSRFNVAHRNIEQVSFASTFSLLTEGFVNSLRSEEAARAAIESVSNKQKPIIGVDKTAELSLQYLYDNMIEVMNVPKGTAVEIPTFPDFKVVLDRWAQREGSRKIIVIDPPTPEQMKEAALTGVAAKENKRQDLVHWREELNPTSKEFLELESLEKELVALIQKMPDLPLSPIDRIKVELNKSDISIAEVSGRKLHVRASDDGAGYVIEPFKPTPKAQAQFDFNSNKVDAIIVTRSGTEGISLHAQAHFTQEGAHNKRHTMLVGSFFDIVQEEQFFGRGERKAQVTSALTSKIVTGMPVEARMLALSERNRLRLSASTTGNSQSLRSTNTIPNLMNNFGNDIVAEYLSNNPEVIDLLGFDINAKENIVNHGTNNFKSNEISNLSASVLGRMSLLNYEQQNSLLDELTFFYNAKLASERAKGLDPVNTRLVQGKITVLKEGVLSGNVQTHYKSEFDKPVVLQSIAIEHPPVRINTEVIEASIISGNASIEAVTGTKGATSADYALYLMKVKDKAMEQALLKYNQSALVTLRARATNKDNTFKTVQEALADKSHNKVQVAEQNFNSLLDLFNSIDIGEVLQYGDREVVITKINTPKDLRNALNIWNYEIIMTSSSGAQDHSVGVNTFLNMYANANDIRSHSLGKYSQEHAINEKFKDLKLAGDTEYINVLTGNIVEAARLNADAKIGSQIMLKDNETGRSFPAIRAKKDLSFEKIINRSFGANADANDILMENYERDLFNRSTLFVFDHSKSDGTDSKRQGEVWLGPVDVPLKIVLPKTKVARGSLATQDPFNGLECSKSGINRRTGLYQSYKFEAENAREALNILNEAGFNIQVSGSLLTSLQNDINKAKGNAAIISSQVKTSSQMDIEDVISDEQSSSASMSIETLLESAEELPDQHNRNDLEEAFKMAGKLPEINDLEADKVGEDALEDIANLIPLQNTVDDRTIEPTEADNPSNLDGSVTESYGDYEEDVSEITSALVENMSNPKSGNTDQQDILSHLKGQISSDNIDSSELSVDPEMDEPEEVINFFEEHDIAEAEAEAEAEATEDQVNLNQEGNTVTSLLDELNTDIDDEEIGNLFAPAP